MRVGQRLIRWDRTRGSVALHAVGQRVFGTRETCLVEWLGLDGTVEGTDSLTLASFDNEGVRFGCGLMPWVKKEGKGRRG
jgi:hypothetical protein